MGEALYLVIGGLKHEHALIFASSSVLLQVFVPYRSYAPILKFLTLVLFLYVAVVFTIEIPWPIVLAGTFVLRISLNHDYLLLIVAVFGTTISPYLFFWQASQEVEEMRRERSHPRRPMMKVRSPSRADILKAAIDVC
jgi:Mn2+/Fe2+ NRAMP family transporter